MVISAETLKSSFLLNMNLVLVFGFGGPDHHV